MKEVPERIQIGGNTPAMWVAPLAMFLDSQTELNREIR